MSKERDWVDYAQLGLSAAQTTTLAQISGQMRNLADETARMRQAAETQLRLLRSAEEMRQQKARRLNDMLNMVWLAEGFLAKLETETDFHDAPQRAYVYTHQIENTLEVAKIIPPVEFEDLDHKDRVRALVSRIKALRVRISRAMTEEQRQEAELCWKFMSEDEDLGGLIERRTTLEQRQSKLKSKLASLGGEDT